MNRILKESILNRLKGIGHINYKKLNFLSLLVRNIFKVFKQKGLISSTKISMTECLSPLRREV